MKRFLNHQEGTSVVEFALVASLFVLVLFGMWDFGRLFDAWLVTTNAAFEGARYGAIYGANQDISQENAVAQVKQKTLEYLGSGFGTRSDVQPYSLNNITVQFPNGRIIGERVEVTVSLQVDVWPLVGDLFFGGSDSATTMGRAAMRM